MIPLSTIMNLERLCVERKDIVITALSTYTQEQLEDTRNELVTFRDEKNKVRYLQVFNCIDDILEDRTIEVINLQ